MDAPLLTAKAATETVTKKNAGDGESLVWSEVKKQQHLAVPLVAGHLLVNVVDMVSIMFVGHIGKLELAGASVAIAFTTVTGFGLLSGIATGLDTLCGQAFGAGQHHQLGVHKQRAMLVITLVSVPVAALWTYAGEILAWCGQDPAIAAAAGSYATWLIPALFVYGPLECHVRFLQTQNVVVPVMLSSGAAALGHPVACWVLARKLGLGSKGVAMADAVTYIVSLSFLAIYVRVSPTCKDTWTGFSREAFGGILSFFKLAVPSALMVCIEWWSFELPVLLSGLLANPELETAVLSICLHTFAFALMVPIGLGAAISTRVSNELGAGRPHAARLATWVVVFLAFSVCVSEGAAMVLARNLLGYAYSNDQEVAKYTARLVPVLAVAILFDGMQSVLSGVIVGCGQQNLGAIVNLIAFYVVGVPAALFFAFACHLGGVGLWCGLSCGMAVQMLFLLCIALCTNWKQEALKAKDRIFD